MFFRIVGWLSVAALACGIVIMAIDVIGIRSASIPPRLGLALFVGALFVSGLAAAIETFFFRQMPRRERWLEYYKQCYVPFRAIEVLLSHRRRR